MTLNSMYIVCYWHMDIYFFVDLKFNMEINIRQPFLLCDALVVLFITPLIQYVYSMVSIHYNTQRVVEFPIE